MVTDVNNASPKYSNITPLIKTEDVNVGNKHRIKATVKLGQMTLTAFSDEVIDIPNSFMLDYAQQAMQRAMSLVPTD